MAATHIFHKLVFSARLFIKRASWGCCVLVLDSSREPAAHPKSSDSCAPGCSGTEFELGRTTSSEEGVGATVNASIDYEWSMSYFNFCNRGDSAQFSSLLFFRSNRSPSSWFWREGLFHRGWNEEAEEIKSARISRRLMPLARSASAEIDFSSRNQSQTLLEQALDNGMYHFKWGFFYPPSMAVPHLCCFCFGALSADPVFTPNNAAGHKLVTPCRSICSEEWAQRLESTVTS